MSEVKAPRPPSHRQQRFIRVLRRRAGEPEIEPPKSYNDAVWEIERLVRKVGRRGR